MHALECACYLTNFKQAVVPAELLRSETIYHLQPGGAFIQGGPKVYI